MRIVLLLLTLLATPAFAQDWGHYANPRFGFSIDIPPGFELASQADNGDGATFYNASGAMDLAVWGANLLEDFDAEAQQAQAFATEEGYNLTYQATTSQWTSFSGTAGGKIIYQRMELLCDGQSWAAFRLTYGKRDIEAMNSVVERLMQSLEGDC